MAYRQPGWRQDLLEPDPEREAWHRRREAEMKQQRKTKGTGRTAGEDEDQSGSQHRYNLRTQRHSPRYREAEEDDDGDEEDEGEEESGDEDTVPARQNLNTSHKSASDTSHLGYSDSSYLSSTASSSFSFHHGSSPVGEVKMQGAYPDLSLYNTGSPQDRSPLQQRRGVSGRRGLHPDHESSPFSSPENRSRHAPCKPRPDAAHPKKQSGKDTVFGIPYQYWLILLAVIFVLVWVLRKDSQDTSAVGSEQKVSDFDQFSRRIEDVKKRFPGQTERFWKVVRSCTKHVFDPDLATYPAILLMVGQRKHAALSSRIAEAVQQEFESVRLKRPPSQPNTDSLNLTASVGKLDINEQKLFLDEWLKERLDNDQAAVVVNHLESLLPEAALLLHSYCDGDNAPYKEALLIWGLFLEGAVDSPRAAEGALQDLWTTEFMRDKIGALLSRVANNIVLVSAPSDETK